jgi:hypothetical protein
MKFKLIIFIMGFMSIWIAETFAQNKTVGIVVQVKGEAKIQNPGAKASRTIEAADPIADGTRITVDATGSVSFLFCPESISAQVGAGADITFSAKSMSVNKGVVSQKHNVPYCRIPVLESLNSETADKTKDHVGGTGIRGDSSLVLLSPVRTHVVLVGTTLNWKHITAATSYLVQVKNDSGDIVWEGEVKSANLTMPSAVQLQPETLYRWRVTAKNGEDVLGDASTWFKTLSNRDQIRLNKIVAAFNSTPKQDEWTKHFMLGALYEELDMPDQAMDEYRKIQLIVKSNN